MVFKYAGLDWAAALVFFVVITAAASALNSPIYSAGRHLYQLAQDSESPAMQRLGEVSDRKVPAKAIIVSGCMILFSPADQRDSGRFRRVRAVRLGRQRRRDLHLHSDDACSPPLPSKRRLSAGRLRDAGPAGVRLDCGRVLRGRVCHVVPVFRHARFRSRRLWSGLSCSVATACCTSGSRTAT